MPICADALSIGDRLLSMVHKLLDGLMPRIGGRLMDLRRIGRCRTELTFRWPDCRTIWQRPETSRSPCSASSISSSYNVRMDWYRIGILYWHIGLGLAECQHRLVLEWHIIEDGFSESSSVETLRLVPYSTGSLNKMGDCTLDWPIIDMPCANRVPIVIYLFLGTSLTL